MNYSSSVTSRATLVRIFACFAIGYFLSYMFRTVNAVLGPDLARDLSLDATDLGLLTSAYFVAFAAVQVPLGILLDRFGPRRVEASLLVTAAAGAALFAMADGLVHLLIGRALIGIGVSACLMAGFKALASWFSHDRLPFLSGLLMVFGALGAVVAATPVELALHITDWRGVFWLLAIGSLTVATLLMLGVPDISLPQPETRLMAQIQGVWQIFSSPIFWRTVLFAVTVQGTYLGFQGLWAGEWMRTVEGLSRLETANLVTLAAMTMAIGFFASGLIADFLARYGIGPLFVPTCGMGLFMVVHLGIALGWPVPHWISWGLFGLLGSSSAIVYPVMAQQFPPHLSGRVNTSINLLVFVGAFAVQALFAPMARSLGDGVQGYRLAMLALFVLEAVTFLYLVIPRRSLPLPWRLTPPVNKGSL